MIQTMSPSSLKSSFTLLEAEIVEMCAAKPKDFLWHLAEPWREHFDHDHWWEKTGMEQPIEAWLWEIFRRQPTTLNHYLQNQTGVSPLVLPPHEIAKLSFLSWPKLKKRQQQLWREDMQGIIMLPQHGYNPGAVIVLNDYRKELPSPGHFIKVNVAQNLDCARRQLNVFTHQGRMTAEVVERDNRGKILLAIDPCSTGTGKRVEQIVKAWRKDKSTVKIGKPRPGQWGEVIASFENQELARQRSKIKRNHQSFVRYRRIIAGLKIKY